MPAALPPLAAQVLSHGYLSDHDSDEEALQKLEPLEDKAIPSRHKVGGGGGGGWCVCVGGGVGVGGGGGGGG